MKKEQLFTRAAMLFLIFLSAACSSAAVSVSDSDQIERKDLESTYDESNPVTDEDSVEDEDNFKGCAPGTPDICKDGATVGKCVDGKWEETLCSSGKKCQSTKCVDVTVGTIIVSEDFEGSDKSDLEAAGWSDIAGWETNELSFTTEKARTGNQSLKVHYGAGSTGGWMHFKFPEELPEVYIRYYRFFSKEWEWPSGFGPHDTSLFAGSYSLPTYNDLCVKLDFWNTADTVLRVASTKQNSYDWHQILRMKGGADEYNIDYVHVAHNVSVPDRIETGKWHCIEYYARISDPGVENGHLKLWVNGKLVSDIKDLPFVDKDHYILFNRWMLGPYFHGGAPKEQSSYLDNVVISNRYIGTIEQNGNQPPVAHFTNSRAWGDMEASFDGGQSSDPDGTIAKYSWEFGDGATGEGETVSHTYASGNYTVKLTVTDDKGETHSMEFHISVGANAGSGDGLNAEYYDGANFDQLVLQTTERQINFVHGGWTERFIGAGKGKGFSDGGGRNFSCRWSGFLQPAHSENYTLTFEGREGTRVWFDGKLIMDLWNNPGTYSTHNVTVSVGNLVAGKKYPIKVEHYDGGSGEVWKAKLYWESQSTSKEIIPETQFYLTDK